MEGEIEGRDREGRAWGRVRHVEREKGANVRDLTRGERETYVCDTTWRQPCECEKEN